VKVIRMVGRIGEVLDGDELCRIVLAIHESGDAKNAVAVCAGDVAVERHRKQLERHLLRVEVKVLHAPQHLVFARRCGDDHVRLRHKLGSPERSEPGFSVHVDVDVQMANGSDAILGALPATGEQRIRGHIDIRSIVIFMSEPTTVTWCERTF